jgi:Flp pilus assembly protein TadD
MTISVTIFLSLLLLFSAAASSYTQGVEWGTLNDEVQSLYQKGQYERAVVVTKKALEVAEKAVGPNHPDVATSLNNLAVLYDIQGQYAQADRSSSARSQSAKRLEVRTIPLWPLV